MLYVCLNIQLEDFDSDGDEDAELDANARFVYRNDLHFLDLYLETSVSVFFSSRCRCLMVIKPERNQRNSLKIKEEKQDWTWKMKLTVKSLSFTCPFLIIFVLWLVCVPCHQY